MPNGCKMLHLHSLHLYDEGEKPTIGRLIQSIVIRTFIHEGVDYMDS